MAILNLLLVHKLLTVTIRSILVAGMAVALTGVGILREYGLRNLLLYLSPISIGVRFKS